VEPNLGDDLAATKFATRKVLTYRTREGDLLVALQVQPKLETGPAQPCDYLLLVDTSASQVGLPLANACILTDELIKAAGANDRVSIWTANIPDATKELTRGFQSPTSEKVKEAFNDLKWQVPLGDTDLPNAIEKATKAFQVDPARRRVLVFMGDGMSIHNPVTAELRTRLCDEMVKNEIAFYSVPLGPRLDPQNLHGFASGTGGIAVRILKTDKPADTLKRLQEAVALPVLYPASYQMSGAEAADTFPTKLPPLRTDVSTLVLARTKAGQGVNCRIEGKVAGKPVHVDITEPMATPELDNFFLVGMFEQWKKAKDQPALMRADRALAFAHDISELARTEFLAQAEEALVRDRLDVAKKLYGQAKELDPSDAEADGGLKLVQKLQEGKITKEQLRKEFAQKERVGLKIEKTQDKAGRPSFEVRRERMENLLALAEQAPKPDAQAPEAKADKDQAVDPQELLRRQRLAQQVEDQRVTKTVNEAINEARRALRSDPEAARDRLKQIRAAIVDNFEVTENVRQSLLERLEGTLRYVETEGTRILRDQAQRLNLVAVAEARIQGERARMAAENQLQQRIQRFVEMMRVARFEDGFDLAMDTRKDLIDRGLDVPPALTAAVRYSLTATHLRESQRLRYLREERFLATMLQVELSHVPFPDEPPIVFPPAAKWRKLTELRKERYESSGLSEEDPLTLKRIRDLKALLNKAVTVEFDSGPLKDALGYLQDRYNIPIIVDEDAFKEANVADVKSQVVKLDKVVNISLGTVLRLLLAQVQGTYVIRREYVEVTTAQRQAQEKALRVYPVADLVIPIPNAINQQGVNQTIQNSILGGQFSPFGGAGFVGGALGLAGVGGLGLNIGLGGLGGLGGFAGLGGLGGLGGIGGLGGFGLGGAGLAGAAGLGGGQIIGVGGPQNLGVGGGGFLGFAGFGGQLGQFGNLGGQFGLQGGDQSQILITLIRQVVGTPADWSPLGTFQRPQVGAGAAVGNAVDDEPAGDPLTSGALGYYPPARALVVKGTSRVHTRAGGGVLAPRPGAPPGNAMLDKAKRDFVASNGKTDKSPVVAAKDKKPDADVLTAADAKKLWQDALLKGVTEPGLIIAVTDFLAARGHFDHVVEFLKSELRAGLIARPWVYEALAIALQESKGSLVEIEQAQLSSIDLEPQDAQSFLRAAQAMTDSKRWDRALAFCKQASILDPNSPDPYLEAMSYAERENNTDAMEWAAGNLLSRDWPIDNQKLQKKAGDNLRTFAALLRSKKPEEAGKLTTLLDKQGQRDLVIQLVWQGDADLDLEVKEPIGTVCNFMQRQTPGGGTLMENGLTGQHGESYTAALAFTGEYRITINRIWGKPVGSKATLKIIEHQGTPQQKVRQETIVFDRSHSMKFVLDDGRRTSLAQVSPTASQRPKSTAAAAPATKGDTLSKLRALADPTLEVNTGMKGGMASPGVPTENKIDLNALERNLVKKEPAVQFQVASAVPNGLDFAGQVTLLPDGQQRVTFNPVFQTMSKVQSGPLVNNPLIPGGK
jgi:hypothetical protein